MNGLRYYPTMREIWYNHGYRVLNGYIRINENVSYLKLEGNIINITDPSPYQSMDDLTAILCDRDQTIRCLRGDMSKMRNQIRDIITNVGLLREKNDELREQNSKLCDDYDELLGQLNDANTKVKSEFNLKIDAIASFATIIKDQSALLIEKDRQINSLLAHCKDSSSSEKIDD
jgi:hypothetical protein